MANRPKKNKSARDKKIARQRSLSDARKREEYPLYHLQPPFEPYQEWFNVPKQAADTIEHPARHDNALDEGAKDLLDTLVKLGPRYNGMVPMAAILLDRQMLSGTVAIAVTGRPGYVRDIPVAALAAEVSDPETLARWREEYPDAGLPEETSLMTDDAAAWHIHSLHINGLMVMDDDGIMNLVAGDPRRGKWVLNGHLTEPGE
ncbi:hypothetical protein AB0A76_18365 [Streptomyces exfoliatus]|uniref:Uncharacterized protein n=1 Tax=Streptomyces exfoliatus TaxID=1905 RepID=A0ABV3D0B9_STREX